ncbi:hypothetical protein [Kribbella speibonae]|uniref:Uncharacterized protein n=1 Tax=Kribbella speibonae TaxID=1572660 RepID=A0A4R0IJD8_9ACTN|nr:hypothetical protein [Kribbella speibonae]TCC32839.1 hypothetical protein E0H92_32210 [Kribbella speibonae]
MALVVPLALIVLGSLLLDAAVRMLLPPEPDPAPSPANPIFRVLGLAVMVLGLINTIRGVGAVLATMDLPDPYSVPGARAIADAAGAVVWGAMILTIGAYIWRGAKRRGARDRGGRLLIVAGYVLVAVALSEAIDVGTGIWNPPTDPDALDPDDEALVTFLAWGAPGAALVHIGAGLAHEKILAKATFST